MNVREAPSGQSDTEPSSSGLGQWKSGSTAMYDLRGRVEQRALKRLRIEPEPPSPEVLAEIARRAQLHELRNELAVAMATLSPSRGCWTKER